jgi:predicted nucleic acid-binding protein
MDWALERRIQCVTCPAIIREYREVMHREKFARYGFPPYWLEFLIEESLLLTNPEIESLTLPDPQDRVFLALARTSGAWLATGNLKHFPEACRAETVVISPADYLTRLTQSVNS